MRVALLMPQQRAAAVGGLAHVLVDCVDGGASIGFLAPLSRERAVRWWTGTLGSPHTRAWVARDAKDSIIGCVLLSLASPDNARHRAEVRKLLVHRRARGRGVATSLMAHVEQDALGLGRTLLLLDTQSGGPAETLYLRSGWVTYGTIADHARLPDGRFGDTTFMVKRLDPAGPAT